ncbi:MAG: Stress response protein NhaX [Pelotomaculum sp. PtaB.Bin104]|nr:MAG: Stress response protein NhaX [Pelotomaculum sp. PtaB.Bin104]
MIKKILVAYDFEEQSQRALQTAIQIAKNGCGEIYLVTSVEKPGKTIDERTRRYYHKVLEEAEARAKEEGIAVASEVMSEIMETLKRHTIIDYEKVLEKAAAEAKTAGVPVQTKVLYGGKPGESIVNFAKQEKIDIIALGSSNRGPLDKLFLGSVSHYVTVKSNCAVLIVK